VAEIWYAVLAFTIVGFAILDGWNLGAGAIHFLVGRTDVERRSVIRALGPLWSWHELWLVAAAGVLFLAFPRVLAAAFSGFYMALFLILWAMLLRGIAIEFGEHLHDHLWRAFWDTIFALSSSGLALLFGLAIGNALRGVPLGSEDVFSLPLFTDFRARGRIGILDWYTALIAAFTWVALAAHGAAYLALRAEGPVRERSRAVGRRLWVVALVLLPAVTMATASIRPELFPAMAHRPLAWLGAALVLSGAVAAGTGWKGSRTRRALLGTGALLGGLLIGAAAGLFPVLLPSTTGPDHALTAYNSAAGGEGAVYALVWWPLALGLAIACALFVHRHYRGKLSMTDSTGPY
jgi:cytochrome d ubiquinol oxidase subunit II